MKQSKINKLKRAEQRKILIDQKKKKNKKIVLFSSITIIAIIFGVVIINFIGGNENIQNDTEVEDTTVNSKNEIIIPLSGISNEANFYSYDSDGVKIKYFAVTGSDSEVRVALDACDVCYGAKKGYVQNGDVMHCINCGNEYPIDGLGTENTYGGCWPSFIPIDVNDGNVIIKISDLENKRYMFA